MARKRSATKSKWKKKDRCRVDFGTDVYPGTIIIVYAKRRTARIEFDDGDDYEIPFSDIMPEEDKFDHYDVEWDDKNLRFKVMAHGGKFYGDIRRSMIRGSETIAFAIDLRVQFTEKIYTIKTIGYVQDDPRKNMQSLNADICAAINQWWYNKCHGDFDTIERLEKRAMKPTVRIKHLATIDRILRDLRDVRDDAIRTGGHRCFAFEGDNGNKEPNMRIDLDLSREAAAFQHHKRIPSLFDGYAPMENDIKSTRAKKSKRKTTQSKTVQSGSTGGRLVDIERLAEELRKCKDPKQKSKIRRTLRKIDHNWKITLKKG
jgi:hypothetical protein